MAFTNGELLRGALAAWAIFLAMLLVCTTIVVTASWSIFSGGLLSSAVWSLLLIDAAVLVAAAIISVVVMAFGMLVAKQIGMLLRREPSVRAHAVVYAALGLGIGKVYVLVLILLQVPQTLGWLTVLIFFPVPLAALAVPLRWWRTARLALLEDRGTRVHRLRVKSGRIAVPLVRS